MIRSNIQTTMLDGINLVYFCELSGKTSFIEKMAKESNIRIFILDFDAQFTGLKANNFLDPCFYQADGPEIFLPVRFSPCEIVKKLLEVFESRSLIVLDSLNGLFDYLDFNAENKSRDNLKSQTNEKIGDYDAYVSKNSDTGYKALILLKILFQSPLRHKIPTIITSYISQRWYDEKIRSLIGLDDETSIDGNHFEKISKSISFVRYDKPTLRLFLTTVFNQNLVSTLAYANTFFPQTIRLQ